MAKKIITGIVLRDKFLEWVSLICLKDSLETTDSGQIQFDNIEDVENENGNKIGSEVISEKIKTESSLSKNNVTIGLFSSNALLRVVSLPVVEKEELKSMVQLQVDKFSPFPIESMVVSHEILKKDENVFLVLIAAVKQDIVEDLGKLYRNAGIFPVRVDLTVLGWWFLFSEAGETVSDGRQILLILDKNNTEIIALQDGVPMLFRSLDGIAHLDNEAFIEEIVREVNYTFMSLDIEYGENVSRSISAWTVDDEHELLCEKLKSLCLCDVKVNAQTSLSPLAEGIAKRTALQNNDNIKLDLAPTAWHIEKENKHFKKQILIIGGIIFGVLLLGLSGIFGGFYLQQRKLASLKTKSERLKNPAMEVGAMRRRVFMIKRYIDRSHSALECLRQVSSIQPQGVDLTSFSYRKGESVRISGEAVSVNLVYDFKNKLDGSELFLETTLHGPRRNKRKRTEIFDIDIRLPGVSQ